MPFTISDFHDLVELLEQNPSWRAEIRRLVLTDDILRLPKTMEDLAASVDQFARSTEARFVQLEGLLADLAAAQRRTEQRMEELAVGQRDLAAGQQELAAAQRRTEQRVEELAVGQQELAVGQQELVAAQRRTEQRVEELAVGQQELAAAQRRTEQRLDELAAAQKRTSEHVARLENIIGVTVEEEAAAVLRVVLEAKGYRILAEEPHLRLNGDVDVAHHIEDAQGRRLWAVLEAKARLGWQAVEAWAKRMRSEGFRAALREIGVEGPFLVYVYGMRADLSARKAAEKFGIGLLSSQGEIVSPAGEFPA